MTGAVAKPPADELMKGRRGTALVVGAGVILMLAVAWYVLPLGEWLLGFTQWIRGLGAMGWVVFTAFFVLAVMAVVPASILYLAAGLLYDIGGGFALSFAAATLGSALCFLIARYGARERVKQMVQQRAEFEAVDDAVRDEGWKVVLLLRLAPLVPGNTQGWLFGITDVPFWQFILPTMVGIVPWALLFVGLGKAGGVAFANGESALGPWQWALMGAGVVVLGVIVWLVGRRARTRLERMGIVRQR